MRKLVLGMVLAIALSISGVVFWLMVFRPQQLAKAEFANYPVSYEYSADLRLQEIPANDPSLLSRITNPEGVESFVITLEYEGGLRIAANTLKKPIIDLTTENASKLLPASHPDFKEISRRKFSVSGHDASEIIFTYTGPAEEAIKTKLLILVDNDDRAYYLRVQSKSADFNKLDQKYFQTIVTSLRITN